MFYLLDNFGRYFYKSKAICARVAELVDALALGASGSRCRGSSPLSRTTLKYYVRFMAADIAFAKKKLWSLKY